MANYVSLDEAAKILGVSPEHLVEMRSRGEIFGYRDGSSWKFKSDEIERVQAELAGDALDEDAGGSSILVSERQVGASGSKPGSTVGRDSGASSIGFGSDLKLMDEDSRSGSDVKLVADPGSGSDVRLVKDDSRLDLDSDLKLAEEGGTGSDVELGSGIEGEGSAEDSGLNLLGDSGVISGSDLRPGSSGLSSGKGLGSELELATDEEDELVLGSDSGIGLASESGINLMSPSDSGLSLEEEPLDLAGTGISGLDLGAEISGGSSGPQSGVGSSISGLGSGALVDFTEGEEFQLTPSGGIDTDDDSGSQVIELEDSAEFGSMGAGVDAFGAQAVQEEGGLGELAEDAGLIGAGAAAGYRALPETPYTTVDILLLLSILTVMCISGVLVSDLARNFWGYDGQNKIATGLTDALVNSIGGK